MALSKSSLSGCFEFTPASGFALKSWSFLCLGFFSLAWAVTPYSTSDASANAAKLLDNRFIPPQFAAGGKLPRSMHLQKNLLTGGFASRKQQNAGIPFGLLGGHPGHCRKPIAPHLVGRPGRPCREPRRRQLRF